MSGMTIGQGVGIAAIGLGAVGLGAGASYLGGNLAAQSVDNVRDGEHPVANATVGVPLGGSMALLGGLLGLTGGGLVGLAAGDTRVGNLVAAGLGLGGALTGAVLGARAATAAD